MRSPLRLLLSVPLALMTVPPAWAAELPKVTELSHRCNGWEGRWFFRSMRDRDINKMGQPRRERDFTWPRKGTILAAGPDRPREQISAGHVVESICRAGSGQRESWTRCSLMKSRSLRS